MFIAVYIFVCKLIQPTGCHTNKIIIRTKINSDIGYCGVIKESSKRRQRAVGPMQNV